MSCNNSVVEEKIENINESSTLEENDPEELLSKIDKDEEEVRMKTLMK